ITALVRDANNNFMPNVTVSFHASSGGLAVTQAVTDAGGAATAMLDAAGDPTNRQITVTATTGTATATVPVDVTGTTITMTGPANVVQPGTATYSVSLADSSNGGISGAVITVSSANHNGLSPATITTDSTGHASFQLTAANSGADTLTATGLGIQALQSVGVSNQSFAISSPAANAHINLGVSQPVVITWTSAGVPVANQPVAVSATRGTLSAASVTTNAQGQATVNISSSTSGGSVISATGTGVSAQLVVDFIATTPSAIAVQASPSTVNTGGKSTVTAVVRDAQNNLVEGQTVNFQLTDNTGGTLSTGTTLTNSQGVAETVYTASATTSATNGVVISASVQGTSVTGSASLTVAGKTVFLSLGTGNLINSLNDAQYSVTYAVQAIDGAGNGVDGVAITMTTTSLSYIKGSRVWNGTTWATVASTNSANTPCASEDLNHNGILDPGEDVNLNGKLDPGAVASVTPGSVTTSGGGNAIVKVIYPKDHAYYVSVSLTATATVQGTQTSTSTSFLLPGAAGDFNTQSNAPPGPVSPYGQGNVCANPN
ncbi:MAG: Ig-like domain-containing protein, partial [Pseudomonadota bacterium]|nr:Ig-like domain-containing protein [Pseudomonadota bacterium]